MPDDVVTSLKRRLAFVLPAAWLGGGPVVPVVRLSGAIGLTTPFRPSLTLAGVARTLEKAFAVKQAPAVALVINSPGGSPVQSHLIHKRIRALAEENEKHVFAFVEDVAASGGYMIACAADEIVADPSSIVGSIGVVSSGFGFDRLMEKVGVDRRVYTAGTRKSMLDPFRPEQRDDVERLEALQREVHGMFVDLVRRRRGDTLSGTDEALFSGEFWVGAQALGLGLVDDLGDLRGTLRTRYGTDVEPRLVAPPTGWLLRGRSGLGGARMGDAGLSAAGSAFAEGLVAGAEERALWARYGL